jgi:hypothetical protein
MAENIVAGLFGLTPQMYGEQQRRSALREGIDLAQLDPASRGAAMTYAGAKGLGGAIAGAFGIEDPQLKLISARNSIFQQIDQSNPESMVQGIKMLSQAGDQQGAMALAEYYRKAQSETALAQQRTAAANRERVQSTPEKILIANQLAQLNTELDVLTQQPSSPERDAKLNLTTRKLEALEQQVEKPNKTVVVGNSLIDAVTGFELYKGPDAQKYSEFAKTLIDAGLIPGTEPFQKRMLEYATKKVEGAGKGTGNVTIGGITVDTGAAAKAASKIVGENLANVENQFSLQTAYKDALSLLNKGIYAGAFGPEQAAATKFSLGSIGNQKKLENTEVFLANIGEIVIPRLVQFGGNDSNEELKYLQNVVAGNQRLEPESMKRILTNAEKKVQNNIERLRLQAQSAKGGTELPISPVATPTQTPTKRYNPQTRQLETVKGN